MHKQSNKDIQSSEVFPEGYNCYRKDQKDDPHGGGEDKEFKKNNTLFS